MKLSVRITQWLALFIGIFYVASVEGRPFRILSMQEPTIADMHAAMQAGELTCRALVHMYIDRIEAYDKKGPALNAIVMMNPQALAAADALDAQFARSGLTGPLHCIPIIVKDNYNTTDMPTTAGSLSLQGSMAPDDAFQVRKLREAGAIMLAKSNMAEFAWSPFETVNSILPGYTKNPTISAGFLLAQAVAQPPRSQRILAPSGSAQTRETPFAARLPIPVWSAFTRPWGLPVALALCPCS